MFRASTNEEDALVCTSDCPQCGAAAGVACRDLANRAKRKPAYKVRTQDGLVPGVHVARRALATDCATCGAAAGEVCRTPTGRTMKVPPGLHPARLRPFQVR